MNIPRFIVIEGNIGAGKTSLATLLAREFDAFLLLETFTDNPFLERFYKNTERYALATELTFLTDRYTQLQNELQAAFANGRTVVADYYFAKSLVFAHTTLQPDEYSLYYNLYRIIYNTIPKPDVFVYLQQNTNRLLSNIKKRGRTYEQNISAQYLESIEHAYHKYIQQHPDIKYVVADISNMDFVNNQQHYNHIKNLIINYFDSQNMHILPS